MLQSAVILSLVALLLTPFVAIQAADSGPARDETLILADPEDPYYPLAEEIAGQEGLPIAHTLDEALAQDPSFLLWIISPLIRPTRIAPTGV